MPSDIYARFIPFVNLLFILENTIQKQPIFCGQARKWRECPGGAVSFWGIAPLYLLQAGAWLCVKDRDACARRGQNEAIKIYQVDKLLLHPGM